MLRRIYAHELSYDFKRRFLEFLEARHVHTRALHHVLVHLLLTGDDIQVDLGDEVRNVEDVAVVGLRSKK